MIRLLLLILALVVSTNCTEQPPEPVSDDDSSIGDDDGDDGDDGGSPITTVTGGDILLVSEPGSTDYDTMSGGAIVVIDKNGSFKGAAVIADPSNDVLRYPRGMKLQKHPLVDEYLVSVGTSNSSLMMEVHWFTGFFDPTDAVELTGLHNIWKDDRSVENNFFAFGFTPSNVTTSTIYLSDRVNGYPIVRAFDLTVFSESICMDYDDQPVDYSGWHIGALDTNMGWIGESEQVLVGRYKNDDFAVDTISNGCASTNVNLVTGSFPTFGAHVTGVTQFTSWGDDWDQDIFLTVKTDFGPPAVYRYDSDNLWAQDTSPFTDTARAMYWISDDPMNRKIWTLEDDGTNYYIRRYDGDGVLEATLFTDAGQQILYVGNSVSIVVIPEL